MATLADRVAWCERYYKTKEGKPWTAEGRQWVIDELMLPSEGFKWWPVDEQKLCWPCKKRIGELSEWTWKNPTATKKHRDKGCAGLQLEPVIVTVCNLHRGMGKTTNAAANALSTLDMDEGAFISYVASSGEQTEELFEDNFASPVRMSKRKLSIVGRTIYAKNGRSKLEWIPSSNFRSATGRRRSLLIIEEAREIEARMFFAMLPFIFATKGWKCPNGHLKANVGAENPKNCNACGDRLIPWFGRVLIISSSGVVEDGERAWFNDLVQHLEANPDPNFHLYRSEANINPAVEEKTVGAIERVFSQIESTKVYVDVEIHNQPRRKGEPFVTVEDIRAITDPNLEQEMGSDRLCVGFLDTSAVHDLTSLVILRDDAMPGAETWSRVLVSRIDTWDPKKQPAGVIDEKLVQQHLDDLLPLYPALINLGVDVRGKMPWAERLLAFSKKNRRWGRKLDGFNGNQGERNAAFAILDTWIEGRLITTPEHPILRKELLAARRIRTINGGIEIREQSRKVRHLDIVESLAECCRRAHVESLKTQTSFKALREKTQHLDQLFSTRQGRGVASLIGKRDRAF